MNIQASKSLGLLHDYTNALRQQLFFWGCDVMSSEGNLLCEYGFERLETEGLNNSSCYKLDYKGDIIELHGFCVGRYTEDGSSFLFTRNPCKCYLYDSSVPPVPGFHDKALIKNRNTQDLQEASLKFLEWWMDYEDWILERMGSDYRDRCFKAYKKLPKTKAWLPPTQGLEWLKGYLDSSAEIERAKKWKTSQYQSERLDLINQL